MMPTDCKECKYCKIMENDGQEMFNCGENKYTFTFRKGDVRCTKSCVSHLSYENGEMRCSDFEKREKE